MYVLIFHKSWTKKISSSPFQLLKKNLFFSIRFLITVPYWLPITKDNLWLIFETDKGYCIGYEGCRGWDIGLKGYNVH